jgi:hypothetical protein
MANDPGHTHGTGPAHTHENAYPGHSHDGESTATGGGTAAGAGAATAAAAATEHEHPGVGRHTHADAGPGHTHDYAERTTVSERAGGGLIARLILGIIGAAGMIIGPFLVWVGEQAGTEIEFRVFFSTEAQGNAGFAVSAGFALIILGVVALVGLAFRSGWLTSLAAGLGILAMVLIAITAYRAGGDLGDLEIGYWIAAVGSVLALIASMMGAGRKVTSVRSRPAERL